jgi:hypothetical protein
MACNNLDNLIQGTCENNSGGIFYAKIFDMDDVSTYSYSDTTWEVTGLTLSSTASTFEFRRNTSNYTSEAAIDLVNGSTYQNATINFVFHRREAAKSKAIKIIAEGQRYLGVVIGDANGKYWYFPNAQVTAIAEGSGTARADGSKYSVTLIAELSALEYEVPLAIYSAL